MSTPTIYLCGPMTGLPDYNHATFEQALAWLEAAGYTVVSPTRNGLPKEAPWSMHMEADMALLATCGAVCVLPGCDRSKGCRLELTHARLVGLPVKTLLQWIGEAA